MKFGPAKLIPASDLKVKFSAHFYQRGMKTPIAKQLAESMRKDGFWKTHPVVFFRHKNENVIVWGHHRLDVAAKLKIPAWIVEVTEVTYDQTIQMITDENWNSWALGETVRREVLRQNEHYLVLQSYLDRGMTISCAASLLSGESAASNNHNNDVRKGTFTVKTREKADTIIGLIERRQKDTPIVRHTNFVKALSRCMCVPQFSVQAFEKRLQSSPINIGRQSNYEDFTKAIEEVYNYRSSSAIPLAFMADQEARRRSASRLKERSAA